jgi:hypothetical protein
MKKNNDKNGWLAADIAVFWGAGHFLVQLEWLLKFSTKQGYLFLLGGGEEG